jgi:alpha-beta hydrolase superfamily lysophospholipase
MRLASILGLVVATVLAVRAYDAWRSPPLERWHTESPDELSADKIDEADWTAWLAAEARVMREVRERVTDKLPTGQRVAANRYFDGSPLHASRFATDWNRSFLLQPPGAPRGAAVLLHGLTDSPYSLRHVGEIYQRHGFAVVAVRMPGHGTVPAGLTRVKWEDWLAATRLAVRHARSLSPQGPLHVIGYSNGAALALHYSLDAMTSESTDHHPLPDQLVLISPMVGITSFARFAGILGWPAIFPAFAKAGWLDILPEYNPFKYNSFPVNAARQSSQLVRAVQEHLLGLGRRELARMPPVLAFQSVADATVSTQAVVDNLFAFLPANGSELVLFDRNRAAQVGPLIRPGSTAVLDRLPLTDARPYTLTLVTGTEADPAVIEARRFTPDATQPVHDELPVRFAPDMYSLSHVALPFPMDDPLYGREPRADESFGVRLGDVAVRGERGMLVVGVETLMRASSNPFFAFQEEKIAAVLGAK